MKVITEVTYYQTEDGVNHATMEEAQKHGDVLELAEFIRDSDLYFEGMSSGPQEIAKWILTHYEIKART